MCHPRLDWHSDEDAVRVAQFVIEWIMAESDAYAPENTEVLRDSLKRTTLDNLIHDLLTTARGDDRYMEQADKLLTLIGVWPA